MRVPKDRSLASWIRELAKEGKLYRFYKTDEWRSLRAAVMADAHGECEWCREKAGPPVRATCVHHVNEVKDRPELALSRYCTDAEGNMQRNLWAICEACHNRAHGRFQGPRKKRYDERPLTDERW